MAQGFTEEFDSNTLPPGWNNSYQASTGKAWNFAQGSATVTNTSSATGSAVGPSWLITKGLIPEPGFGTLVLEVRFAQAMPLGSSTFSVKITAGSSTNYPAYQNLLTISRGPTSVSGSGLYRVKIPQNFWGQECRLAFVQSVSGLLSTDTVSIDNINLESDPLYSVSSGFSSGAVWSDSVMGSARLGNFSPNTSLVIQSGDQITIDQNLDLVNITINPGASLNAVVSEVRLLGNITNKGIFNFRPADLRFDGGYRQFADGILLLGNSAVNNPNGVEILAGTINLTGNLTINKGSLITNSKLVVFSDKDGTGSIAKLAPGALVGSVTIQRFFPAGQADWRFLSSSISGKTFADLNDDLVTSGFPGSDMPGNPFISAYTYSESTGGAIESGFQAISTISDPLQVGAGYYVFCGDNMQGPGAFTVDLSGTVNQGNIDILLSYTVTSSVNSDGYNLIGNPYPSPIDFGTITMANVETRYWIYDPISGNMDMWNEKAGIGLMRTDGNIQSTQGFLVRATGVGASIQVQEKDKTALAQPIFIQAADSKSYLSLRLTDTNLKLYDVAVLNVDSLSGKLFDERDSEKITISHPDAPKLAMTVGGKELGINSRPSITVGDTIHLSLTSRKTAGYALKMDKIQNFSNFYSVLVNLNTGQRYLIDTSLSLSLTLIKNISNTGFVIVFEEKERFEVFRNRCNNDNSNFLLAKGPGIGPWSYVWKNANGTIIRQVASSNPDTLKSQVAGVYRVEVSSTNYPTIIANLILQDAPAINPSAAITDETCPENNDGKIALTIVGGTGPLKVDWSNGSKQLNLLNLSSSGYFVTITDSLGCIKTAGPYLVSEPDTLRVVVVPSSDSLFLGDELRLKSISSRPVNQYFWNFGDGITSTNEEPNHVYSNVGTFLIELRVGNGACSAAGTHVITVKQRPDVGIVEFINGFKLELKQDEGVLRIIPNLNCNWLRIHDMSGKLMVQLKGLERGKIKEIGVDTYSKGIYVVTLMVGEKASTMKFQLH